MGKRERRSFSEEFKREAVALAMQSSGPVSEVARQLGIAGSSLTRWVRESKAHGAKAFVGQGVARDEEMMALRRELAQVKKERDFLRDAAAYFARDDK
jgi:transposase